VDLSRLLDPGSASSGEPNETATNTPTWGAIQAGLEERFEIDFGPGGLAAELARCSEVCEGRLVAGQVLESVRRRLSPGASFTPHPVRPAFARLRDALVAECSLPRRVIRPSARLEELVPRSGRADSWARLGRRLGQPLPPFAEANPPAAVWVVGSLGALLVYAVGVPAVQAIDAWAAADGFERAGWYLALGVCVVPPSFIAGIVLSCLLAAYLFRNRFPCRFQAEYATVGQLARFLAENGAADGTAVPWTAERTWVAVRAILAEAAGRMPGEVTEDTDLIRGLGLPRPAQDAATPSARAGA
jgi:hypothetical protein